MQAIASFLVYCTFTVYTVKTDLSIENSIYFMKISDNILGILIMQKNDKGDFI